MDRGHGVGKLEKGGSPLLNLAYEENIDAFTGMPYRIHACIRRWFIR